MLYTYDVSADWAGDLDLNLLRVFRAVERTRHVSRAAEALGMTQPAVSQALGRLRSALDDALFVKTPRGMVPTARAVQMTKPVEEVLARIEADVLQRPQLHLATLERTFRVRTTDYVETLFAPALAVALAQQAPRAALSFRAVGPRLPAEELESGACDLAVAGFFRDVPAGFRQTVLLRDGFASAVRADHPRLRRGPLTLDAFCKERHALVAPDGELRGAVDQALSAAKRARTVALGASGFLSAAWTCTQTDAVLTAPARLIALVAERFGLRVLETPLKLPEIRVAQVWHERHQDDPAHAWLRERVAAVSAGTSKGRP